MLERTVLAGGDLLANLVGGSAGDPRPAGSVGPAMVKPEQAWTTWLMAVVDTLIL